MSDMTTFLPLAFSGTTTPPLKKNIQLLSEKEEECINARPKKMHHSW
jgi:hypothetical protein